MTDLLDATRIRIKVICMKVELGAREPDIGDMRESGAGS
jgi:hypothetical protein